MTRLRRLLLRLFNVFNRGRAESDIAREVASHLTLLEDDFQRRGMTRDDARRAARLALGGVEQTKELHRDARSFVRLDDARRDLQYAVRLLRRNPLFALTAAASLAIGIGATTTIFTVARARAPTNPCSSPANATNTSEASNSYWLSTRAHSRAQAVPLPSSLTPGA